MVVPALAASEISSSNPVNTIIKKYIFTVYIYCNMNCLFKKCVVEVLAASEISSSNQSLP